MSVMIGVEALAHGPCISWLADLLSLGPVHTILASNLTLKDLLVRARQTCGSPCTLHPVSKAPFRAGPQTGLLVAARGGENPPQAGLARCRCACLSTEARSQKTCPG